MTYKGFKSSIKFYQVLSNIDCYFIRENLIGQNPKKSYNNRGCQSSIYRQKNSHENIYTWDFRLNQSKPSNFDHPKTLKITKRNLFLFVVEWTCLTQKNPSKMPRLSKRATLIRECKSLADCWVKKAYICFYFDNDDSSEDDIDYHILAELAVLKALR